VVATDANGYNQRQIGFAAAQRRQRWYQHHLHSRHHRHHHHQQQQQQQQHRGWSHQTTGLDTVHADDAGFQRVYFTFTSLIVQEAQLMMTTGSTRLAVSRGQQTWYHFRSIATFR